MSADAQLDKLRELCATCHACLPGEADSVADEDLPHWLRVHGHDPDTLEPGTPAQIAEWRKRYMVVMTGGQGG